MFMATGGLPYYYSLWGPGITYSMDMININQKPENKKEIYYNKMIQMMNYYDYTPNKIDTDILKQTYDDNTTLDEFIINIYE